MNLLVRFSEASLGHVCANEMREIVVKDEGKGVMMG